jgi:hypothetical protein
MAALCAAVKALLDHGVGEARAYVQGESLKARAALHVRLSNSPAVKGEEKWSIKVNSQGCAVFISSPRN